MRIPNPINQLLIITLLAGAIPSLLGCSHSEKKIGNEVGNTSFTTDSDLKQQLTDLVQYGALYKPDPKFEIQDPEKKEGYSISRISIRNQETEAIPGYLLVPANSKPPFPVMICLQGHSPGMHISIGEARTPRDSVSVRGGRDFALQAIRNGWAAVVIEQQGFGERAEKNTSCHDLSLR